MVARKARVVGEGGGVEVVAVVDCRARELHRRVVGVRREDGIGRRVIDDGADAFADRRSEGVVAAAHTHQKTQVQRIGELLPLGDITGIDGILGRVVHLLQGVVERVGGLQVGHHGLVDLLLRVDVGLEDALVAAQTLGVGYRTEHVGADGHVVDLQREADGLEVGLVLVDGQLIHVVGILGPLVAEIPDLLEVLVAEVVAVLAARRRLGDGHLRNLVGDGEHVVVERVGSRVEQRFQHRNGGDGALRKLVGVGVVLLEIPRAGRHGHGGQGGVERMFQVFHGLHRFRTEV